MRDRDIDRDNGTNLRYFLLDSKVVSTRNRQGTCDARNQSRNQFQLNALFVAAGSQVPGSNMAGSESRKKSSMANSELKSMEPINGWLEMVVELGCKVVCVTAAIDRFSTSRYINCA